MAGTIEWRPQAALSRIQQRLVLATETASAEGADRAREIAPLGKGEHQATGANPRFLSIELKTTREFAAFQKTKVRSFRSIEARRQRATLRQLRTAAFGEVAKGVRVSSGSQGQLLEHFIAEPEAFQADFFKFSRRRNGEIETPDVIALKRGRGPGGVTIKGARTGYTPGRLKKGIRPLQVKVKGTVVRGGYESTAPYSNLVEHGFHHRGGTEVEGKHFMKTSAEALREPWNKGAYLKE